MKTRVEVERLKQDWILGPCWELAFTVGFEEYEDELRAFSEMKQAEWKAQLEAEDAKLTCPKMNCKCMEGKCAWWTGDKCAMLALAQNTEPDGMASLEAAARAWGSD